jgi:exodeoxyribonuclease V alpha subunit
MYNMKDNKISILYKSGYFSEIDIHFARFITGFSEKKDLDVFLGAALVSRVTGNGDVCLNLASMAEKVLFEKQDEKDSIRCPKLYKWQEKLCSSPGVGRPGDFCPLILDEKNRLYLYRYWEYEKKLSDSIKKRVEKDITGIDLVLLKESLKRLFQDSTGSDINWQKVASFTAMFKRFCVISGGPGTGKTTTVAKILALLLEQADKGKLRIMLAAPTGKAAARLMESIKHAKEKLDCRYEVKDALPAEASTIHRMLKTLPGSPYFRHNAENPLLADVVVVDEASMVDLALMSKLVQAIPDHARLILMGDKDQLASVEAGSVLGDICNRDDVHRFSEGFCYKVNELAGENLGTECKLPKDRTGLLDCIVCLKKSYRFEENSGIGGLSRAINQGDPDQPVYRLKRSENKGIIWKEILSQKNLLQALAKRVIQGYSEYLETADPSRALDLFNRFKILCAVKIGPFGVDAVNTFAEQVLSQEGLINPGNLWYRGRPILITRNDYNLGLFNGDIGIIMPVPGSDSNDLYAFFSGTSGEPKRFLPHRLPEHETVYAMTVHKSQGSEFDNVILVLPDKDYPVLTRELIYTGVTRARQNVSIWGNESVLRASISRQIERTSGLRDALWV